MLESTLLAIMLSAAPPARPPQTPTELGGGDGHACVDASRWLPGALHIDDGRPPPASGPATERGAAQPDCAPV